MARRPVLDPQWATVRAAREAETRKVVGKGHPDLFSPLLTRHSAGEEADAAERHSAAVKIADLALGHPCELDPDRDVKVCTHPDHERDREWARTAISLLGIPGASRNGITPEPVTPTPQLNDEPQNRRVTVDWHDRGACNGHSVDLFYGYEGETRGERNYRVTEAKKICRGCPVRTECLDHALTYPERHGIWGGLDEDERDRIRKNRREARRRAAAKQNTAGRGEDAA